MPIFWKPFKVHRVNLSLANLHFDGRNFGGLYLPHPTFVFNKICWVIFSLEFSYCGKFFMLIQVAWNVWKQFEVQNPTIFGL